MKASKRLVAVPEFPFSRWGRECAAAQEQGGPLIRLDVGNPDLPPPPAVVEAACQAIRSTNAHGYPGYRGSLELRPEPSLFLANQILAEFQLGLQRPSFLLQLADLLIKEANLPRIQSFEPLVLPLISAAFSPQIQGPHQLDDAYQQQSRHRTPTADMKVYDQVADPGLDQRRMG